MPQSRNSASTPFGIAALTAAVLSLVGCGTSGNRPPIPLVPEVEIDRFMGAWYVIASIPTFIETDAYNAVERYELNDDGTIATTFTFREGGFDGELKTYHPTGFVRDEGNGALWGMQFIWPIKAEYRIVHLDDGYTQTVVARNARDYAWIMARTPEIPDADYQRMVSLLAEHGYDVSKMRRVPQRH